MKLFASPDHKVLTALLNHQPESRHVLGYLNTPRIACAFERITRYELPIALDNGAFSNFQPKKYRSIIQRIHNQQVKIEWITVPDKVGDCTTTLSLFQTWQPELADLPLAYVGQDGCEDQDIPWTAFVCLFIGGTTKWKLSTAACSVMAEAKRRGKTLHLGRVNSLKRIRFAYANHCDSFDGSQCNIWSRKYLNWTVNHLLNLQQQPLLF